MSQNLYANKTVLITGGAGFVGSNLAHALAKTGARLILLDNFHPDYGANEYNLRALREGERVRLVKGDIVDQPLMLELAARK